jgi:hypothetical protein
LIEAFGAARRQGLRCLALLGGDGGDLRDLADVALTVPSADTPHVQEVHLVLIHMLCGLVEQRMMGSASPHSSSGEPARRTGGRTRRARQRMAAPSESPVAK